MLVASCVTKTGLFDLPSPYTLSALMAMAKEKFGKTGTPSSAELPCYSLELTCTEWLVPVQHGEGGDREEEEGEEEQRRGRNGSIQWTWEPITGLSIQERTVARLIPVSSLDEQVGWLRCYAPHFTRPRSWAAWTHSTLS